MWAVMYGSPSDTWWIIMIPPRPTTPSLVTSTPTLSLRLSASATSMASTPLPPGWRIPRPSPGQTSKEILSTRSLKTRSTTRISTISTTSAPLSPSIVVMKIATVCCTSSKMRTPKSTVSPLATAWASLSPRPSTSLMRKQENFIL